MSKIVKTIKLREPLPGLGPDGGPLTELQIRKPKGKDFRLLPADAKTLSETCDFAISLCDQTGTVFDRLDGDDAMELLEVASGFFPEHMRGSTGKG